MSDTTVMQLVSCVLDTGCTPEEACRDEPELLADVRAELRRIRALDAQVEAVFPSSDSALLELEVADPAAAALPHVPGHDVLYVLGHGGMGVVYAARHQRLKRIVAVKMLLRGAHTDAAGLKRLMREAEAIATLRHPNIVQVHDVGEHDGLPWFTMELVEGGSLRERIEQRAFDPREAASLVALLAEAIAVAHASGIVHRDLKPANVLLTPDGVPKIADFGLARRIDVESSLTQTDAGIGTPSYMAPEQARGGSHAIGPATDVYALGAILYATLTGRPPFRSGAWVATLRQVIEDDPERPSKSNPRVPRDLETICLECLAKDPSRRYPTAAALAEDLRRFVRGEPIAARPVGSIERAAKWARRRPAHATIAAGAALALIALAGAGMWLGAKRAAIVRAVEEDFAEVDRAAGAASWAAARTAVERAKARLADGGSAQLAARVAQCERELALVDRLEAIRLQRADVRYRTKTRSDNSEVDAAYASAFRDFGLPDAHSRPRETADRVRQSRIRAVLVSALDTWATSVTADDARRDGLLEAVRLSDPDPSGWRDRVRDPASWKDGAALAELTRTAPVSTESVMLLLALAEHVVVAGGDAVPFLERVQREHPHDFWANSMLGVRLAERSEADPAPIRYFQAAVAVRPDDAFSRANLGSALGAAGQLEEAELQLRKAIEVEPANVQAHVNLSSCLNLQGRMAEAMEELRIAVRLDPLDAGTFRRGLIVQWLVELGRYDESIVEAREAVRLDPRSVDLHLRLGYVLHAMGRIEEACDVLHGAIAIESRHDAHRMLGSALEDLGRIDDAITTWREAVRLDGSQALVRNELMNAMIARGLVEDAREQAQLLVESLSAEDPRVPDAHALLGLCELILRLDAELPAIQDGARAPQSIPECLAFADLFRGKGDYRAATRFYAEAFDRFGRKPSWSWRTFDAARCAALAGAPGDDAGDAALAEERARWRSKALAWLRVGVEVFDAALAGDAPGSRWDVLWGLMEMKAQPAFAPFRDAASLERLPEAERTAWSALWTDVEALRARATSAR